MKITSMILRNYSKTKSFVARSHKNNPKRLFNLLYDNELAEDMDNQRTRTVNQVNSK